MQLDGTNLTIAFAVAAVAIIFLSYAVKGMAGSGPGFGRQILGKFVVAVVGVGALAAVLHLAGVIRLPLP